MRLVEGKRVFCNERTGEEFEDESAWKPGPVLARPRRRRRRTRERVLPVDKLISKERIARRLNLGFAMLGEKAS